MANYNSIHDLLDAIADALREKMSGAQDFSTMAKFNAVLSSKIGWTVSQSMYNYIDTNVISKPTVYPNFVIFGTDRGGNAADLWFIMNQNSGENFRMSDVEFITESSGVKFVNRSNITLKVGRLYGYGAGKTVVDSNPGFDEGNVTAGGTFQASAMKVTSNSIIGTAFENIAEYTAMINAQDFPDMIRGL